MNGRRILLGIILLTSILLTTIVYSAFNTQLNIEGEAIVRSEQDIRITNISISNTTNGAYETYNNKYNKDTTFMYVTLPSNSSITYEVTITNNSNDVYSINNIIENNFLHQNANYEFLDCNIGNIINSNSSKICHIKLNNYFEEENITLILDYLYLKNQLVDLSGHGNNATIHGAILTDNGLVFDGIDDFVVTNNVIDYNATKELTIEYEAKINSPNDNFLLFESSNNFNLNNYSYHIYSKEFFAVHTVGNETNYNIRHKSGIFNSNDYTVYTVTFNSNNSYNNFTKAYVNGSKQELSNVYEYSDHNIDVSNMSFNNYKLYIASRNGNRNFANMILKNLKIYTKELSQTEINNNLNGSITTDNLILYYKFD